MIAATAFLGATLGVALAAPAVPETHSFKKRWEDGVDCTTDLVDRSTPGLLFAVASDGTAVFCDEIHEVSTEGWGATCYVTVGNDRLGDIVKCPADPAPTKNPDGTDAEVIADGFIGTWCDATAGGLAYTFAQQIGCLVYGYYEANGDVVAQNEAGATAVCNAILFGFCTYMLDVAPAIWEGRSECVDPPDSSLCSIAGPGK
ncbi:hypothetical protein CC79DRAFT_1377705 [Sarocladium strictum]